MKVLLSVFFFIIVSCNAKCKEYTDSLLRVLKSEILKKKIYDGEKDRHIKKLKETLASVPKSDFYTQYAICDKLYQEYKDFVFDSAHVYTEKLLALSRKMNDLPKLYESKIKLGTIQSSWGMFKETFECLSQIDVNQAPDSVKLRYYELKSKAYTRQALYNTDEFYSPSNRAESIKALTAAIRLSKPGSYEKYRHLAELCTIYGQNDKATAYCVKLLNSNLPTYHERAMIAHDLSNLTTGPQKIRLITLAAIYDIRSSTKETLAIFTLGKILMDEGKIEDAEILLQEALDQASIYGNKMHKIEIVAILTTLSAQKLINSENKKNEILTYLITILSIAIAGVVFISVVVYARLKRVKRREAIVSEKNQHLDGLNKKLSEDAQIKEEYIGYFFDVISGYILKLEKIKRNTERKIKIQNYEELLHLANQIDIKQERHILFHTFDNIFLKLFPNFITSFNALLRPEDQIWPKDNEILNTNLRIFALIRLGIKDTQTIANILQSAVSTIYTYKTRIKSKALVQGDDFENKIMEIDFVDIESVHS